MKKSSSLHLFAPETHLKTTFPSPLGEVVRLPDHEHFGEIPAFVVETYMLQCRCTMDEALKRLQKAVTPDYMR